MTITGGTALSKEEIERMIKDAERFAAEDRRRREAAEARNAADQLTYQVDARSRSGATRCRRPTARS
ncbi:MAG: hypothetical protein KatS3mg014_0934 [Actinomycetota bacterium]|nr:MAG: hypothetical protein KatS3mg014_0934 [Actinomycetota bacterium]